MTKCRNCSAQFQISPAERELRRTISPQIDSAVFEIPDPTFCPQCRMQRRMLWRGELNWYKRKSDYSGRPIVSYLPQSAPCKVYSLEEWWGDGWTGLDYGREYDFSRPFFEQFQELIGEVPLPALNNYQNENCEYINCAASCRNCYLLGGTNYSEDCYYGNYVNHSKNCVDNNFISKCELVYQCIDCSGCYGLSYAQNCDNCSDSAFLYDCRSCDHCFGCCNLTRKSYHFFNQPLSKAEYHSKIAALELHKRSAVERITSEIELFRRSFPYRYMSGVQNENVCGNAVSNSRNCDNCFDASLLEDCRHCAWLHNAKNCMDIFSWGMSAELCYECTEVGSDSYQVAFSATSWGSSRLLYCYLSRQCQDLFGCMGLVRKQYCILNRQYNREQYCEMVPRIIAQMRESGEWGEFFPFRLSPQPYNSAVTNDYFPLDQPAVERLGAYWFEPEQLPAPAAGYPAVPDCAAEIADAGTFCCAGTGKPFRITAQELDFYRRLKLAPPAISFPERHRRRLQRRNPRQLWDRCCSKCGIALRTSYLPEAAVQVYCESCFAREMG